MKVTIAANEGKYIFEIDDCKYSEFKEVEENNLNEIEYLRKSGIETYFHSGLQTFYKNSPVMNFCGGDEIKELYKKIKKGFETKGGKIWFFFAGLYVFRYWPEMVEVKPYENK